MTNSILGIDPGYDRLGWAVVKYQNSQIYHLKYGCIQTDKDKPLIDRYQDIQGQLAKIINSHQAKTAVLESLFQFLEGFICQICFREFFQNKCKIFLCFFSFTYFIIS